MKKPDIKILELNDYKFLYKKDERELYTDNKHDYYVNHYRNRVDKIITTVKNADVQKILEIGCAQSNISLSLAEDGYSLTAFDINYNYLRYSKKKYEKGDIGWVQGEGYYLPFGENKFDCVILAEILEHCAYPEKLLVEVKRILVKGGISIITTPNNNSELCDLLSFDSVKNNREKIEEFQFGPDGDDHLFTFKFKELSAVIKDSNFKTIKSFTLNHHFLMWRRLYYLRHYFSFFWKNILEYLVPKIPLLKNKHTHTLFFIIKNEA